MLLPVAQSVPMLNCELPAHALLNQKDGLQFVGEQYRSSSEAWLSVCESAEQAHKGTTEDIAESKKPEGEASGNAVLEES